jgi:hypothetical protein
MARTATVTRDEIFAAADAIVKEGGNPTLATVRERVGGGSYTTISAAMEVWRRERVQQEPATRKEEPIPDALVVHARAWWEAAIKLATEKLQAERDALAVERRESERQRQEAADLADQLAAELDEARAQIVRLEGADKRLEVAKAESDQARREAERARIAEQAVQARLEAAAREMEDLRQRVREAEERARKAGEGAAELRGRLAAGEAMAGTDEKARKPCRSGKTNPDSQS